MTSFSPGKLSGSGDQPAGEMQGFHSFTAAWFEQRFAAATPAQLDAWPRIRAGGDVLISAPTGSGKTLAAFLSCLDRLVTLAAGEALEDRTAVVYVSPLKALSTDIHRNLQVPLGEIAELAERGGRPYPEIRTAIRTGDTPTWDREQMVRRPPHIVVTTPESLFILLTAERSRRMLSTAETVIVDEIHALIDDKRGSHLALSLARLDDLVVKSGGAKPQRIGLSATVKPIGEVARFLTGTSSAGPATTGSGRKDAAERGQAEPPLAGSSNGSRSGWPAVDVVDSGHRRELDLAVEVPQDELGVVATNEMWGEIYDRIADLVRAHRTTIVFVNTRRLSERVAHHLAERLGEEAVLAHHGSLSRQLRQTAEAALKEGRLRAVVATASLELGIDVGSVDLVCQIGTPRSIAVALQRIGRSGHKVDRSFVPKGRFFATTRDELIECAALVRAMRRGLLDERRQRPWPRDVLAQQIVGGCGDRDLARGRPVQPGAEHGAVLRPAAHRVRRGRDDAVGRDRLSPGSARHLAAPRPGERRGTWPARSTARRHHLGRGDSRQRQLPRRGRAGRDHGRHRRRGLRRREHGGRHLPAGHDLVAHPPRRVGTAAGGGRARRGAVGAVLARRGARGVRASSRTRCRICASGWRRPRRQPTEVTTRARSWCGSAVSAGPARSRRRPTSGPAPPRSVPCRPGERWWPNASSTRGAACSSCCTPARSAHQPGLGAGAAQAVLPQLQRRAASRRDRQRHRDLAFRAAQLSAGGRLSLPAPGDGRGGADAGDAARADVRRALALERVAGAGGAPLRRGAQGAAPDPAHAL